MDPVEGFEKIYDEWERERAKSRIRLEDARELALVWCWFGYAPAMAEITLEARDCWGLDTKVDFDETPLTRSVTISHPDGRRVVVSEQKKC